MHIAFLQKHPSDQQGQLGRWGNSPSIPAPICTISPNISNISKSGFVFAPGFCMPTCLWCGGQSHTETRWACRSRSQGLLSAAFQITSGSTAPLYYCGTTKWPLKRIMLYFPEAVWHYRRDANQCKAEAQSIQKTLISRVEVGCHPQQLEELPLEIHIG